MPSACCNLHVFSSCLQTMRQTAKFPCEKNSELMFFLFHSPGTPRAGSSGRGGTHGATRATAVVGRCVIDHRPTEARVQAADGRAAAAVQCGAAGVLGRHVRAAVQ